MVLKQASAVVIADRAWFLLHSEARVRFRPETVGEFSPLESCGHTVPVFLPPEFSAATALTWVAVIELSRCLDLATDSDGSSLRIRLRTLPIRSRALQRRLAPIYEEAVVQDFLLHTQPVFAEFAA